MDTRYQALEHWLKTQLPSFQLQLMAGDASFRRYFRVHHAQGSLVAMDAPPDRENCLPFIAISNTLQKKGLCVPAVLHSDVRQGFLLLSDLGDLVYLKELSKHNAEKFYDNALDALAVLQTCREVQGWEIPLFTAEFMYQELQTFKEWFFLRHLDLVLTEKTEKMLDKFFWFLSDTAASQPQVFMHRDYHSGNLMVLPDDNTGILDFQDAFLGPVTYDLVSLLRDCYITWPEELVNKLVLDYKEKIPETVGRVSRQQFIHWFDIMGMQRHLKALLTFSRKLHRDLNPNYLQHIPRTLNYVRSISMRYRESQAFHTFLAEIVLPELEKVSMTCVP